MTTKQKSHNTFKGRYSPSHVYDRILPKIPSALRKFLQYDSPICFNIASVYEIYINLQGKCNMSESEAEQYCLKSLRAQIKEDTRAVYGVRHPNADFFNTNKEG